MNKILLLPLFVFFHLTAYGQYPDSADVPRTLEELTTSGIATGIHLNRYPMLELGYYRHTIFEYPMTLGGSYTVESYFIDKIVIAPKVNYWFNIAFINAGFSVPWYIDFEGNNSLRVRPELGFGYNNFKINYAMNISLTNKDMEYVGKHFISVNHYIRIRRKRK
jgi:hypothetical protein